MTTIPTTRGQVVQQDAENQQLHHDDVATHIPASNEDVNDGTCSSNDENNVVVVESKEEHSESSISILEQPVLATAATAEFSNVTRRQQQQQQSDCQQIQHQQQQQLEPQQKERQQRVCDELNFSVVCTEQSFDDNISAYENDNMSQTNHTAASTTTTPSFGRLSTTKEKHFNKKAPETARKNACSHLWTQIINDHIRRPILLALLFVTQRSARYPRTVIAVSVLFAIAMTVLGYINMSIAVDADVVWTPIDSKPALHKTWLRDESDFPGQNRAVLMVFHANGKNVLDKTTVDAVFEALDGIRTLPDYGTICSESETISDQSGEPDCEIHGVVEFWGSSTGQYLESIQTTQDLIETVSAQHFASSNIPVAENLIFGQAQRNGTTHRLTSAVSLTLSLHLPANVAAEEFETEILDTILGMDQQWQDDPNNDLRVAINANRSMPDE